MMSEKTMVPKLMIAAVGRSTYVFLEGKCISEGVEDLKYSARDEKGNLCPTLDLKIDVKNFSFESGMSIEEFMKKKYRISGNVPAVRSGKEGTAGTKGRGLIFFFQDIKVNGYSAEDILKIIFPGHISFSHQFFERS